MMHWIKLGCGHLVALPLLLAAGFCALLLTQGSSISPEEFVFLGAVILVAGGTGGGLLVYLWRGVWHRAGEQTEATPSSAASAPSFERDDATGTRPPEELEALQGDGHSDPAESPADAPDTTPRLGPDERPWNVRDAWRDGHVSTERGRFGEGGHGLLLFGGAVFFCVGVGIGLANPEKWPLTLIFGTIGLSLMGLVGYWKRRQHRFGETTFEMDTLPGVLGGPLCGVLHTGVHASDAPKDGFHVKLSCYRRHISRDSDGDRSVKRALLWRDEKQMKPFSGATGETLDVPVVFEIPDGNPPSTPEKKANRYMWALEVSAAVPGVDYRAVLEIPVFPVVDNGSAPVEAYSRYVQQHTADTALSRGVTVERPHRGHLEVTFGRARRPWAAVLCTVLDLGLIALTWLLLTGGSLFVAGIVGMMAAALGWGALHFWTYRSTITLDGDVLRVRAGVIGGESETVIPCAALESVTLDASGDTYVMHLNCNRPVKDVAGRTKAAQDTLQSMTGNRNPSTGESWDDYMKRHGMTGDRVVAARMITHHQEAEWIASQIEEAATECARYA